MRRSQWLRATLVAVAATGGLAFLNYIAPLQWPSALAYSGLVVMLAGVLAVFAPLSWTGFSRRWCGLLAGFAIGAVLFAAGWFWPTGSYTTAAPATRLDAFMPAYNFYERHEILVQASPALVREELNRLSFADIGVMKTLGAIRGAAMGIRSRGTAQVILPAVPFVEMTRNPRSGFFPLDDTPAEFVFGLAGRPWDNAGVRLTPGEFKTWAPPGNVKIAANFRIEDAGGGRSRVITETRIAATDEAACRKMARYWALIYPGSGMVRRSLLKIIRDRAEGS
jgi:hypothetical protein